MCIYSLIVKGSPPKDVLSRSADLRIRRFILWLIILGVSMYVVPPFAVILVWLLAMLKLESRLNWRSAIGVTVGMGVLVYVVFIYFFGASMLLGG